MKKYTVLIFTSLILILSNVIHAQNDDKSWTFGAGFNMVDVRVPSDFSGIVKDYFNGDVADLNFYGAPLRLSAEKELNKGLSVQLAGSLNKIKKGFHPTITLDEANFVNLDAKVKYGLSNIINRENGWFDPFVGLGIGFSFIKDYPSGNDFKLGAGGGFNAWVNPNFALSFDTYYHHNFNADRTGTDFFQHAIGVVFKPRFGIKDADGDTIKDRKDKCPKTFGVAEFDGCPIQDTDKDGVNDSEDKCPDEAGPVHNDGCPWTDTMKDTGKDTAKDTDGDGVLDQDDTCPDISGDPKNYGCPWKDTDGDGVLDKDDACPKVSGVVENDGCPKKVTEIKTPIEKAIVFPTMTFYFERDSHEIKIDEKTEFKNTIYLMKQSNARFQIQGHTEGTVTSLYHHLLSGKRVTAVAEYLVSQGIDPDKLAFPDDENNPATDDTAKAGSKTNRRVTVSIIE